MIYVIGSGPAGIACASGLVSKGQAVTVLDAGVELEPERQAIVHALQSTPKDRWDPKLLAEIKRHPPITTEGISVKYLYGSDYPFRGIDEHAPHRTSNAELYSSLARGGLSTVWGGAVLPYRASDIPGWPVGIGDLAEHYRAVASFMPVCGRSDDLADQFPLYGDTVVPLRLSAQAAYLAGALERNRERLARQGVTYGQARLAIWERGPESGASCALCGLCLSGCPYGLIYSSSHTLEQLCRSPLFAYRSGVVVTDLREEREGVRITGHDRDQRTPVEFRGERVYVAGGVLSTARLMLASLRAFDRTLILKGSQHFMLPSLLFRNFAGVPEEELHTLAQLYIEVADRRVSDRDIHLQVYTYNDLYREALSVAGGKLAFLVPDPFRRWLVGRLAVIQGYLHSDESSHIEVRLTADQGGTLELTGKSSAQARRVIGRLMRKMLRLSPLLRAVPLLPLLSVSPPGRGAHNGGTFPMRRRPGAFETDIWGRLPVHQRIHIVDASVFPSIPAPTITYTLMANAHRIAAGYGTYDRDVR